jgi:hypothetical protein
MNDLKSLLETFKLSFYESIALLLPGAMFLLMLHLYFPIIALPVIVEVPTWGIATILAFVSGYILKGFWGEVADQYRYRFEPWYRGLKDASAQIPNNMYLSKKSLPWYITPWGFRVVLKPVYTFLLWSYVDWRKKRIGNIEYLKSAEFAKIKERVQIMFDLKADQLKDYEYWSKCYGSLTEAEQQERDRFDSISDMLRSLITIVFVSLSIALFQSGFTWNSFGILMIHWVVFRALYNRALRYEVLATRNVYRRFFQRFCQTKSTGDNANDVGSS